MKGIVLAGGTGTRLQPITNTQPKQLVPVANTPVLEYVIEDLKAAGITEIGIVLGDRGRTQIQEYFGEGTEFGVDITYIVQGKPLGVAHAVGCAREFVGEESFVAYLGDNLLAEGITDLVERFDPGLHAAGVGLKRVDDPSQFGVVEFDGTGTIQKVVEKPDDPPTDLAVIGVFVFTPEVFEAIERIKPSWRGELEITDALQDLADVGGTIQHTTIEGWWADTGKPADVLETNRFLLDRIEPAVRGTVEDDAAIVGRVQLGPDSVVESGAVVRGPVVIGTGCTIESGTTVGPYTSIGDGCTLGNVRIAESILLEGVNVRCNRHLVDSIIGREATISSSMETHPGEETLIVGDNAMIRL